ncbi:MAG TPA: transcriptional regulator, partial [Firmicutes bacterium]|nr:transcriptional regulator [Bacillota bacterium]
MDPVKMGHFISECRKEKKLTQEFIANEFGITSQSVSKWESG